MALQRRRGQAGQGGAFFEVDSTEGVLGVERGRRGVGGDAASVLWRVHKHI